VTETPTWTVIRTWRAVPAATVGDAIDAARSGEHHQLDVFRADGDQPVTYMAVRTQHLQDYELINHEDDTRWVIADLRWKRKPDPDTSDTSER
jgi:hypothetical protein